jgi:hypothetical protein
MKELTEYQKRDVVLKRLGFPSYWSYLMSDLWSTIRTRVLVLKGTECRCCLNRASEIHHTSYSREVLVGMDLEPLIPLCKSCHYKVEFDSRDRKRSFWAAQGRLTSMLRIKMYTDPKSPMYKPKHKRKKYNPTRRKYRRT